MNAAAIQNTRLLVVGDVMLDRYWFGEVSRISPEAPVPVVRVRTIEERPGGAANVARNIVAIGARAALLSVLGDDEAAAALNQMLAAEHIDSVLHRDAGIATTIKLRVIGRQQQLLRIDFEAPPSREILLDALADFERMLIDCDVVILSDYGKGGLAHIERMIAYARQRNKPILVDPKGDDYSRYSGATVLTPNLSEFREVVGSWKSEQEFDAKAEALRRELDLHALLITRSEDGMTLFRADGKIHQAAQAREVYDVSGAGDTVIAALGVMLASGADFTEAVEVANRAAGIVVGKFGTAVVHMHELFENQAG